MTAQQEHREESAAPGTGPALARVEGLSVSFPGDGIAAVDDVWLTVRAGECVALVGESGSGKTLTARALLGLLPPQAIVGGKISLIGPGTPLAPAPASGSAAWNPIRGARASLVPQDALGGLDPLRRVEHEVGDALRLHGHRSPAGRRGRVLTALEAAGMPEPERRLRQRSDELSGGLRQRALVASALISDPRLIVADEPTTALDAGHRARVLRELRRRVDAGAGALLISHDLASVRGIADRVLVMRGGSVVEEGDAATVLSEPSHPFTIELLAAAPSGKPRGARLLGARRPESVAGPVGSSHLLRERGTAAEGDARHPRLELRGIGVAFGRGAHAHEVLRDASVCIRPGETVGLLGESGSGKTTLLRVALGLQAADDGMVLVDGVDRASVDRRGRRELRRRIALVPQDPLDSFPARVTGARLLSDALRAAGTSHRDRASRAGELAQEVGLGTPELQRPASTLSGGQRQRLAIARALALDPETLLLDEPVSALDVTVQARVLDLLDDLQERRGTAYLFVSHDEEVIRHMSDRVLHLEKGRLLAE